PVLRDDPPDPATVDRQDQFALERLFAKVGGNMRAMLYKSAVHIGYIQRAVRSGSLKHGPEPFVGGCEELLSRVGVVGGERPAVADNFVALDQVTGRLAYEDIPVVFFGQRCAAIIEGGTCRRKFQQS